MKSAAKRATSTTIKKAMDVGDCNNLQGYSVYSLDSKISDIAKALLSLPRGLVLIQNESTEKIVGVVDAREFLVPARDQLNVLELTVEAIMNKDILEIDVTTSVADTRDHITKANPYATVIVENGKFIGYISPKEYMILLTY